jgi:hypothetical protein
MLGESRRAAQLLFDGSFEGFEFVVGEDFGECDSLAASFGVMRINSSAAPPVGVAVFEQKGDLSGSERDRIGEDVCAVFADVQDDAFRVQVRIFGQDRRAVVSAACTVRVLFFLPCGLFLIGFGSRSKRPNFVRRRLYLLFVKYII